MYSVFWLAEVLLVPLIPLLEGVGCKADILLLSVGPGDRGPVHQVLCGALAWQGALGLVLAVTSGWGVTFFLV